MTETKLVECGICKHEYLPIAHFNHCPICGSAPFLIGRKVFHVNITTNRQIGKPFSLTRSLAETLNKLAQ